jgi:DNA-binding response OmpR family regulator
VSNKVRTRLLIVDDDKAIRSLLATVARRAGFLVDVAKDGLEALAMFERHTYDIAIVDLMMPRLSGYELVEKISTLKPRPVVIVATALTDGDVKSLEDSMVRRVIRKPFDIQAVANALVETAVQIATEREGGVPVAPPEAAKLDVVLETEVKPPAVKIEIKPGEEPPAVPPPEKPPPNDKKLD